MLLDTQYARKRQTSIEIGFRFGNGNAGFQSIGPGQADSVEVLGIVVKSILDLRDLLRQAFKEIEDLIAFIGREPNIADDPFSCVVLDTGRALEEMKRLKDVLTTMY